MPNSISCKYLLFYCVDGKKNLKSFSEIIRAVVALGGTCVSTGDKKYFADEGCVTRVFSLVENNNIDGFSPQHAKCMQRANLIWNSSSALFLECSTQRGMAFLLSQDLARNPWASPTTGQ